MARVCAWAKMETFDDGGNLAAPDIRLSARLCINNRPQVFCISLPAWWVGVHRSIIISRADIERVLAENPRK